MFISKQTLCARHSSVDVFVTPRFADRFFFFDLFVLSEIVESRRDTNYYHIQIEEQTLEVLVPVRL